MTRVFSTRVFRGFLIARLLRWTAAAVVVGDFVGSVERAGIDPTRCGVERGVFNGLVYHDYGLGSRTEGLEGISSVQVRRAVSRRVGVVCVGGARPAVTVVRRVLVVGGNASSGAVVCAQVSVRWPLLVGGR